MAKKQTRKTSKRSATRKKDTPKRSSKKNVREPVTAIGVGKGKVTDSGKLEFASTNRASVYDDMFEALKTLKPGQSYLIPVPNDATPEVLHNRLSAAFRRGDVQGMAPKGHKFFKQTTADRKNIAITLYEVE